MSKTYSNKSNARRAAKQAGLDPATVILTPVKVKSTSGATSVAYTFAAPASAPIARPYRIVRGWQALNRLGARKAAEAEDALEAAVKAQAAAKVQALKAAEAGETPRHKEFAVYGQSVILSPVKFVHKFLDANGKTLSRKDALFQLAKAGVNNHTARTQYQRWFAANK